MHKIGQSDTAMAKTAYSFRMVALVPLFAFVLAAAWAAPVTIDGNELVIKAAFAGKGGNGNGNGKDGAPGQQKQFVEDQASAADEDAVTSVAEGEGPEGPGMDQPTVLPIAEDAEPAATKVVKELAGIPEESALTEEEEIEAIRSGWGTWRTADGPETVIAQ
jgi:hypothetical protein